jgi:hypothetical protein
MGNLPVIYEYITRAKIDTNQVGLLDYRGYENSLAPHYTCLHKTLTPV